MTTSAFNPELRELHGILVRQGQTLVDRLGEAKTVDEAKAIQAEITELNHRVTILGNLLFSQQTKRLKNSMEKVRAAIGDLEQATAKIEDITGFIRTMTSFLTLVDKVIDTAKLISPVG